MVKNRLRRVLADYNADRRDLFSKAGREAAAKIELLPADRFTFEMRLKELDFHGEQLIAVEQETKAFAKKAPQHEAEARKLLDTIPCLAPWPFGLLIWAACAAGATANYYSDVSTCKSTYRLDKATCRADYFINKMGCCYGYE